MTRSLLARVASSAAAIALLAAASARPATAILAGTYRLDGTARVRASPALDRDVDVQATAALTPAAGGRVQVRLASEGHRCDLSARVAGPGDLVFDAGQRCPISLSEPSVRGGVEARLTSGRGKVAGDRLELQLQWDLSGAVSLRVGGQAVELMGREVDVPAGWAPEVPLHGTASTHAAGPRAGEPARR